MAFPTFRARSRQIVVEREDQADEFVSASGRRHSSTYWTGSVRHLRYTVHLRAGVAASAPWAAYDEPGALRAAWAAMRLTGTDTHWDPEGGADFTVKFESPPVMRRIVAGLWQAEIELVEDV